MDRISLAQDNSEQLFKYSTTQKDSILKFFIIDGDSDDYQRLKNYKHMKMGVYPILITGNCISVIISSSFSTSNLFFM